MQRKASKWGSPGRPIRAISSYTVDTKCAQGPVEAQTARGQAFLSVVRALLRPGQAYYKADRHAAQREQVGQPGQTNPRHKLIRRRY
jgi:hypothetical protein